jgi:hypothetical protein
MSKVFTNIMTTAHDYFHIAEASNIWIMLHMQNNTWHSLGAVVKLSPCDQEVTAAYRDPKWVRPFPGLHAKPELHAWAALFLCDMINYTSAYYPLCALPKQNLQYHKSWNDDFIPQNAETHWQTHTTSSAFCDISLSLGLPASYAGWSSYTLHHLAILGILKQGQNRMVSRAN